MTTTAFRDCSIEYEDDGMVRLVLDCANQSFNSFTLEVLESLHAALDAVAAGDCGHGLVLTSAKRAGFAGGLDVEELARLEDAGHVAALVDSGQALTRRIAEWPTPVTAAIHGSCHGAGLELALAARYRVAAAGASLGLPEIHLGLHPYFGGSARLANTIGMTPALQMMDAGRNLDAAEAQRRRLVDAVVPVDDLASTAADLIRRDPGRARPRPLSWLISIAPVRWGMELVRVADDREQVDPASHPASTALRNLWWRHGTERTVKRIRAERNSFLELVRTPGTRNLVRVFVLQERLRRQARELGIEPAQRVHVVGCGELGSELALLLAQSGIEVSLEESDGARLTALQERASVVLRQRLGSEAGEAAVARLLPDPEGERAATADFALEAVDEDRDVKVAVLASLEQRLPPATPIAVTTSTLSVSDLAAGLHDPGRLVGLHFQIAIAQRVLANLVEVVGARESRAESIDAGRVLINRLERVPLVVRDMPGFLVNRLLVPYILEGARRYSRPQREVIDCAARYVGMTAGPLELADWMGLRRCLTLAQGLPGREPLEIPPALQEQLDAGRYGHAVGKGFHDWRGDRRVVAALPPRHTRFRELGPALIAPIVEEAQRCLADGVVGDEGELEVAAVVGAGFPAYTGGPIRYHQVHGGKSGESASAERKRRTLRERLRALGGAAD